MVEATLDSRLMASAISQVRKEYPEIRSTAKKLTRLQTRLQRLLKRRSSPGYLTSFLRLCFGISPSNIEETLDMQEKCIDELVDKLHQADNKSVRVISDLERSRRDLARRIEEKYDHMNRQVAELGNIQQFHDKYATRLEGARPSDEGYFENEEWLKVAEEGLIRGKNSVTLQQQGFRDLIVMKDNMVKLTRLLMYRQMYCKGVEHAVGRMRDYVLSTRNAYTLFVDQEETLDYIKDACEAIAGSLANIQEYINTSSERAADILASPQNMNQLIGEMTENTSTIVDVQKELAGMHAREADRSVEKYVKTGNLGYLQ